MGGVPSVSARRALRRAVELPCELVSSYLDEPLLYARFDFVRSNTEGDADDEFWLMEAELIEPALYFRMDEESPARFARALHSRFANSPNA